MLRPIEKQKLERDLSDLERRYMEVCNSVRSDNSGAETFNKAKKILHEIEAVRKTIEPILAAIDWNDAGQQILAQKDQWHHLDFFAQSDWKCQYFGVPKERFKMVSWI
jgi:hypothetical protein